MPGEDATMSQPDPDITDLANIIRDLRREVMALRQDNEDLRDELDRASCAPIAPVMPAATAAAEPAPAAPVAPPARTETRQPKMALPDAFDGSRSDLKCFGTQCLLYMAVRSNDFPGDLSRIAFVLSLMKGGTAGPWATRVIKILSCDLTWEQFDRNLQDAFGEANPGAAARARLESLRMSTNTADEFIQQFETLADESELDEVALIHLFERGLHRSVTEKIYGVEVMPKTLKGWKEYASRFDNQYRQFRALTKDTPNPRYPIRTTGSPMSGSTPTRSNVTTTTPAAPPMHPPATSGSGPMDIDRAHARHHEEFMKKGLCF